MQGLQGIEGPQGDAGVLTVEAVEPVEAALADGVLHIALVGFSGTAALAPLTVGGTAGSLTFANGLLTGIVDPT